MTAYGTRDMWGIVNDALDVYQDDRTDENRATYLAAFADYQADKRAANRRALAHAYGPRYLKPGDKL